MSHLQLNRKESTSFGTWAYSIAIISIYGEEKDNHMSFAAAFHMLLPLFSYTSLVESAALPPNWIWRNDCSATHNMLKQEETKREGTFLVESRNQNCIGDKLMGHTKDGHGYAPKS